ncbi:MAG: cobyrinate a,c-diamide synthase [Nitrospiraceae bacterium]|nr:cobyrinate a,c-diamide synthase [Nitrospiraceae bacterium]
MNRFPRVVIAGLKGGSGKTTLSIGLLRVLAERGLSPAPFKKGPDYIDAGWLSIAAGRPCYNLDPFLIGERNIPASFLAHRQQAGIAIIEGNRGIYDGMDLEGSQSTARLSKLLKAPVVLVMDVSKMTRTAAALVLGVKVFDPGMRLGGVVLNQTAGKRHESILRQSIEHYTGVPVIGAIPRIRESGLSERHMGLIPYQEHPALEEAVRKAAELVKNSVDIDRLIGIAMSAPPIRTKIKTALKGQRKGKKTGVCIGVLRDSAFQFYYPENLEALEEAGAGLAVLSPLAEKGLPDIDALYIGGGFPETHAIDLSGNRDFIKDLRGKIEKGLPVYAECGGLMYLGSWLQLESMRYPMAGIFPFGFELEKKPVAHGYSIARVNAGNAFYPRGTVLQGHEFHYSRPVRDEEGAIKQKQKPSFSLEMERGAGIEEKRDGLTYKNVFATYTHTHALGTPAWAPGMVKAAKKFKRSKGK